MNDAQSSLGRNRSGIASAGKNNVSSTGLQFVRCKVLVAIIVCVCNTMDSYSWHYY